MTHPLTHEICCQIEFAVNKPFGQTHAYIRAAADWQLEQVIEFLESENCSDYGGTLYYPTKEEDESIRETLLRVMRPQEDNS